MENLLFSIQVQEVKGVEDVRKFFMVTASEEEGGGVDNNKSKLYRLFVIGKKSLPEIRKTESRSSERYWASVGGIFKDPTELTKELFSDEFRKGDAARPVSREGKLTPNLSNNSLICSCDGGP